MGDKMNTILSIISHFESEIATNLLGDTTSQITFSSSLSNFIKDLIFPVIGRILLIKVVKALFL